MPKPLIVDAPYPDPFLLSPDVTSMNIISPAYATSGSELNAILQYVYHSFYFAARGKEEIANTLESIAIAEMIHLGLLGKSILSLGAQPIFTACPPAPFNFYSTKYVGYGSSLKSMIENDISGEKHAIASYERMLTRLCNQDVKQIIARILEDEKLHLTALQAILKEISC
jgi:bacterioferritin